MQVEGLRVEAEKLQQEAHGAAQELALRELDCSALRGQLAATHEAAGASMRRVEALSAELSRSQRSQARLGRHNAVTTYEACTHCEFHVCLARSCHRTAVLEFVVSHPSMRIQDVEVATPSQGRALLHQLPSLGSAHWQMPRSG